MSNKTQTEEEKIIQEVKTYLADPKNRLKMYTRYLMYIKKSSTYFLCNAFSLLIKKRLCLKISFIPNWDPSYYRHLTSHPLMLLTEHLPEIEKPDNIVNDSIWFFAAEKEGRVKIVKKAITTVKSKYNLK